MVEGNNPPPPTPFSQRHFLIIQQSTTSLALRKLADFFITESKTSLLIYVFLEDICIELSFLIMFLLSPYLTFCLVYRGIASLHLFLLRRLCLRPFYTVVSLMTAVWSQQALSRNTRRKKHFLLFSTAIDFKYLEEIIYFQ